MSSLDYTLKVSTRARVMRLAVYPGGRIVVTVPSFMPKILIERFLKQKSEWLAEKQKVQAARLPRQTKTERRKEFLEYTAIAKSLVEKRLAYFNTAYGFSWKRVSIRNQSTRWGSCSARGNLSFNYKIALLPEHLSDYIVVHELCHLAEHNHSAAFWKLVSKTMPEYKAHRAELKKRGI